MDDTQVTDALNSGMPDFEDMLQYEAARRTEGQTPCALASTADITHTSRTSCRCDGGAAGHQGEMEGV